MYTTRVLINRRASKWAGCKRAWNKLKCFLRGKHTWLPGEKISEEVSMQEALRWDDIPTYTIECRYQNTCSTCGQTRDGGKTKISGLHERPAHMEVSCSQQK